MIALELIAATLFSSLVGSMHCVGMCTPFAILAMGPANGVQRNRFVRMSAYHLGRLATYLLMGIGVAFLSSAIQVFAGSSRTGQVLGWSVGTIMIGMGVIRMSEAFAWRMPVRHSILSQRWTGAIVKLRRLYSGGPIWLGSFVWGLTSTLLPCGWLYLFVLAAAAAPDAVMTIATMVAFWVGTLPLLTVAAWGWSSISPRWQVLAQPFAAGCIISFGVFILVQRSVVDLGLTSHSAKASRRLPDSDGEVNSGYRVPSKTSLDMVRQALNTDLLFCRGDDVENP